MGAKTSVAESCIRITGTPEMRALTLGVPGAFLILLDSKKPLCMLRIGCTWFETGWPRWHFITILIIHVSTAGDGCYYASSQPPRQMGLRGGITELHEDCSRVWLGGVALIAALATGARSGQRCALVMILPQVHLRKPCYDFTFL